MTDFASERASLETIIRLASQALDLADERDNFLLGAMISDSLTVANRQLEKLEDR